MQPLYARIDALGTSNQAEAAIVTLLILLAFFFFVAGGMWIAVTLAEWWSTRKAKGMIGRVVIMGRKEG
jgi:hypothetical protein